MFEIESLSCLEIAELMNVPVGTVYSRLHGARRQLEKTIGRELKRRGMAWRGQPLQETRSRPAPASRRITRCGSRGAPGRPDSSELARLEAVVDQIPRRSALLARRRARFAAGAATLVVIGVARDRRLGVARRRGAGPGCRCFDLAAAERGSHRPRRSCRAGRRRRAGAARGDGAPDVAKPKKIEPAAKLRDQRRPGRRPPPRERPAPPERGSARHRRLGPRDRARRRRAVRRQDRALPRARAPSIRTGASSRGASWPPSGSSWRSRRCAA